MREPTRSSKTGHCLQLVVVHYNIGSSRLVQETVQNSLYMCMYENAVCGCCHPFEDVPMECCSANTDNIKMQGRLVEELVLRVILKLVCWWLICHLYVYMCCTKAKAGTDTYVHVRILENTLVVKALT